MKTAVRHSDRLYRHRAQFRFPFPPAGVCLTMAHLIENCWFSVFRFQMCSDNSVSCLYFSLCRNFKWFLYLVLKSLAVTPMYVWVVLLLLMWLQLYKLRSFETVCVCVCVCVYIYIYIYIENTNEDETRFWRTPIFRPTCRSSSGWMKETVKQNFYNATEIRKRALRL